MYKTNLYKTLDQLPKCAIHHIHSTAAIPADMFLQLTYEDIVYFNDREKLFKCYPKHEGVAPHYIRCNEVREFFGAH